MASRIIASIDLRPYSFDRDLAHLDALPADREQYDEFGQGSWRNTSLLNASGLANDTLYRNAATGIATEHLLGTPAIARLISDHFDLDALRMVRARNLVDGMVIPHRDFIELDASQSYIRVFVPLEHNAHAFHSDAGGVFQMKPGEVWQLDAGEVHAAVNFSTDSRMFLCLDFAYDDQGDPRRIFRNEPLDPGVAHYVEREPFLPGQRSSIVAGAAQLLNRDTFRDIAFALSKIHFRFDVAIEECFDWLIEGAMHAGSPDVVDKARRMKRYLIETRQAGERFSVNDWTSARIQ